jgi:hypothetical protein
LRKASLHTWRSAEAARCDPLSPQIKPLKEGNKTKCFQMALRLHTRRIEMNARLAITLALFAAALPAAAEVRSAFAYKLSDGTATLPLSWPTLTWDPAAGELYALDSSAGVVRIFNWNGISIFSFGDDSALGSIEGVAPLPDGDMVVLTTTYGKSWSLVRCNFRGEPRAKVELGPMPEGFEKFHPTVLRTVKGLLYLADTGALRVLVLDPKGTLIAAHNLRALLGLKAKQDFNDLRGFNVGTDGEVLGTIPGLFLAFIISPEGQVKTFGKRGSSPGQFNVIGGIAQDEVKNLYVTDVLRAVVMVFDKDFKFQGEFGYRGLDDENLLAPNEVAAGGGRIFVSQSLGGVKAFDVLLQASNEK